MYLSLPRSAPKLGRTAPRYAFPRRAWEQNNWLYRGYLQSRRRKVASYRRNTSFYSIKTRRSKAASKNFNPHSQCGCPPARSPGCRAGTGWRSSSSCCRGRWTRSRPPSIFLARLPVILSLWSVLFPDRWVSFSAPITRVFDQLIYHLACSFPFGRSCRLSNTPKDKALLFQCVSSKNGELYIGFSFRLRSSSYNGTRQHSILKHPLAQTITFRITKAGFVVKIEFLCRDYNFGRTWVCLRTWGSFSRVAHPQGMKLFS